MSALRSAGLVSTVDTLKRDLQDIAQSGNYYITNEIARELSGINNGLDHLKLDGNLLATSTDWRKSVDPSQIGAHRQNALEILDKTAALLFDYKSKMGARSIESKQENQIRELHHWAIQGLKGIQNEMEPYTFGASDRIKQFGDHIGVTDRYTGYRNNLTRGTRDPFKLGVKWMDKDTKGGNYMGGLSRSMQATPTQSFLPSVAASAPGVKFGSVQPPRRDTKGYQTVDSLFPRSTTMYVDNPATYSQKLNDLKTANALNATVSRDDQNIGLASSARGPRNLSVQEQAGINTTFPGKTEYMTRYKRPPMDIKTSHFVINPVPDFKLHGRPLGLTSYTPNFTEYQVRYEWPDGNKIVKLPWRRK